MISGSVNLNMDPSVTNDTVVRISDDKFVEKMRQRIIDQAATGKDFDDIQNSAGWPRIIVPSRLEYGTVKLQTLMSAARKTEIDRCSKLCQESVRGLL